jgi:hypothetical protein
MLAVFNLKSRGGWLITCPDCPECQGTGYRVVIGERPRFKRIKRQRCRGRGQLLYAELYPAERENVK